MKKKKKKAKKKKKKKKKGVDYYNDFSSFVSICGENHAPKNIQVAINLRINIKRICYCIMIEYLVSMG